MILDMKRQILKQRVRRWVDLGCVATGLLQRGERRMRSGLTILMYHRVLPAEVCAGYPLGSLVMPVDAFEAQVAWLSRHARVVPVNEALEHLASGESDTQPRVAISFDDGYADNHEYAAPILEAHGLRATFFVATDFVGGQGPFWFDRAADAWVRLAPEQRHELLGGLHAELEPGGPPLLPARPIEIGSWMSALKKLPVGDRDRWVDQASNRASERAKSQFDASLYAPMTPDQVRELAGRGHEVASHGVSHAILPLLNDIALARELEEARAVLSDWIGGQVPGFCYPNGDSDARVRAAARVAGYRYACGTRAGMNTRADDPYDLRRRPVAMQRVFGPGGRHSVLGFRSELAGLREAWR